MDQNFLFHSDYLSVFYPPWYGEGIFILSPVNDSASLYFLVGIMQTQGE